MRESEETVSPPDRYRWRTWKNCLPTLLRRRQIHENRCHAIVLLVFLVEEVIIMRLVLIEEDEFEGAFPPIKKTEMDNGDVSASGSRINSYRCDNFVLTNTHKYTHTHLHAHYLMFDFFFVCDTGGVPPGRIRSAGSAATPHFHEEGCSTYPSVSRCWR